LSPDHRPVPLVLLQRSAVQAADLWEFIAQVVSIPAWVGSFFTVVFVDKSNGAFSTYGKALLHGRHAEAPLRGRSRWLVHVLSLVDDGREMIQRRRGGGVGLCGS